MRGTRLGAWALAALGGALLLWLTGWAVAGPNVGPGGWGMCPMCPGAGPMPWGMAGGFGMGGLLMLLSMLLFWFAAIAGLVLVVRWLIGQGGGRGSDAVDPVEVARQRYARGEIDREEYERLQGDLTRAR